MSRSTEHVLVNVRKEAEAGARVIEGPAMDFCTEDEITLDQCPFAHRLGCALQESGVSVQPFAPILPGMSIRPDGFMQLHMNRDDPKALADGIRRRFGVSVQFAELVIPSMGLQCVTWQKAGNVWVRHIVDYIMQTDSLYQRWDVLVRTK